MTQRDLVVAGVSAAVILLVALAVVALVGPDSTQPTGADANPMPTSPSIPPAPTLPPLDPNEGSTQDPSGNPNDGGGNERRKPASAPPLTDAAPAGRGKLPDSAPVTCPAPTVRVDDPDGLTEALDNATPGTTISLADGTYGGAFVATASGTAEQPIFLCGGAGAVLDGGNIKGDYGFHLDHASYWRLVGFTITGSQKGVVADGTTGSVIQNLTVHDIGDEAIHLRASSTDNVVLGNTIGRTGLRRDKFGEGVYVGSAVSNWCMINDCQPDRSDRNVVEGNKISQTTAESVDIKEGTTGGVVKGNTFDGGGLSGADSWVDVKGNNWLVKGNTGTNSPLDGFQTHQILKGWGDHNLFTDNTAAVNGPGLGFALRPPLSNVVACDNQVTGAAEGLSNITCP
jgi:nitrous oxidase accessory protein NosD